MQSALWHRGKELDVDDEYDVDGGLEMYEDRRQRGSKARPCLALPLLLLLLRLLLTAGWQLRSCCAYGEPLKQPCRRVAGQGGSDA